MGAGIDSRYYWPLEETLEISQDSRKDLAHMRLVNKAFRECATQLLFQDIKVCFPGSSAWLRGPSRSSWARKILGFSASGLVGHVKRLEIGFSSWDTHTQDSIGDVLLEASYVYPNLVSGCKRLRELVIRGSARDEDGRPLLNESQRQVFHRCIDQLFRLLGHSNSSSLRALTLSLPLAYHFGKRLEKSSEYDPESDTDPLACVLKSLHRLEVSIVDRTGHGGMRYWPKPESVEHARKPNRANQDLLWKFIGSAKNLRSLTVHCTHMLDFDRLCIDGLHFLREFRLMRVTISEQQLRNLIEQNRTSLKAIQLDMVDLDSGTWESIMLLLCTVPRLDHFYIDMCGYTATGTSSRHAVRWRSEPDRPANIESYRVRDDYALGHAQRHVNAVRSKANVPLMTEDHYRFRKLNTLEEEFGSQQS